MQPKCYGIDHVLQVLSVQCWNSRKKPEIRELAQELTAPGGTHRDKVRLLVEELNRRFTYAPNPVQETVRPVPISPGSIVDADEACLFVAALAMSVGIRCRFVGARFDRHWTCFVDYEHEDGVWETIDPLRQKIDREPDERLLGPLLAPTQIFRIEAGGAIYWVAAETSEESVLVLRTDDAVEDKEMAPESVTPVSRADAEVATINNGNGEQISLWRAFSEDVSPRVIACSEWA